MLHLDIKKKNDELSVYAIKVEEMEDKIKTVTEERDVREAKLVKFNRIIQNMYSELKMLWEFKKNSKQSEATDSLEKLSKENKSLNFKLTQSQTEVSEKKHYCKEKDERYIWWQVWIIIIILPPDRLIYRTTNKNAHY